MTEQNSPQFTTVSPEPQNPAAPDIESGVETGPDVDFPPDDTGTPVVDDPTPGGD